MTNTLVLYNPYYQHDVIVAHTNTLLSCPDQKNARVAFGKVRSKLRDDEALCEQALKKLQEAIARDGYLQLFLTDYANMFVAKVIEVTTESRYDAAPMYYREKNLDVEMWFVLSDLRQIVDNDFQKVRDLHLTDMTTPAFANHHYAVYGNSYTYPLEIVMDNPIDYFEDTEFSYYTDMFKSAEYIETKRHLIHYRFGEEIFYALHPNSQESIISAEIEYAQNSNDPLYDFSAVVIKYAKAIELELYLFIRTTMLYLSKCDNLIASIAYQVQGHAYQISDLQNTKPNIGTYKFLLGQPDIKNAIQTFIQNPQLRNFLQHGLRYSINTIQDIRNESAHGLVTPMKECKSMRSQVIGIGVSGMIADLIINKNRVASLIEG
jgi:hypothetical protein